MSIAEKITRLNTAKNDIATAITNKGVTVAETDGFEEYPALIDSIEHGGSSSVYDPLLSLLSDTWIYTPNLSFNGHTGFPTIFDNELYWFKGGSRNFYKCVNKTWNVMYGDLPVNIIYACAVELNGEMHFLGGSNYNSHCKWDGEKWISVSTLPFSMYENTQFAIVYNGEIHAFCKGYSNPNNKSHYKFNGEKWIFVSTLPGKFDYGGIVIYDNELHVVITGGSGYGVYKYNGNDWVSVTYVPVTDESCVASANGKIYMLYSDFSRNGCYSWDGHTWKTINNPPPEISYIDRIISAGSQTICATYPPYSYIYIT